MRRVREIALSMELGECPLWDHRAQALYWVDIIGCTLFRLDWASGDIASWPLPGLGGGLGLLGESDLIVAVQTGLFRFGPQSGAYDFLLHPSPDTPTHRLNEGKVDGEGNFWIGTISTLGRLPECGLFRVTPEGDVQREVAGIAVPNALVFRGQDVLFADSAARLVWRYEREGEGLGAREVFVDDSALASIPDGACADVAGRIWNAKFGGARLVAYDAEGAAVEELALPTTQITSCAFCGPDLDHLAVTSAKRLLDAGERRRQPSAGNLFLWRADTPGVPEPVCPGIDPR